MRILNDLFYNVIEIYTLLTSFWSFYFRETDIKIFF